jgi:hypothetical protein
LNRFAVIAAAALVGGSIGCSTLQLSTDYAPGTDFARYRSFTINKPAQTRNPIAVERLGNALGTALSARGLAQVPEGGDLTVFAHFVLGKETQINTTGYGYGGWGGWRWGGGMQSTTVEQIPTGTLVVDLVDSSTKTVVWRGIAKDQISMTGTPEEREAKANEVARQLFEGFPPRVSR